MRVCDFFSDFGAFVYDNKTSKGKGQGFPRLDTEHDKRTTGHLRVHWPPCPKVTRRPASADRTGADPGVQAVSPQVTISHPPGGRLPLLSARPAVISTASEHHRPLAVTKLYCLVTEAHRCEQLAQGCYAALPRVGFEPATY